MKLLFTATAYPPSMGGAQLLQHQLARNLAKQHQLQVVAHWDNNRTDWLFGTTFKAPSQPLDYQQDGISVHRIGLSQWEKIRLAPFVPIYYPLMDISLAQIANLLQKHLQPYPADLIHNVRIGREGLSYASYNEAKRRDIPFILTPVHHPRWTGWRYRLYNELYRLADRVITLTEAEKRLLISLGVAENRVVVTGTGPDLAESAHPESFLKKYQLEDKPIILFVAQHYPYKGYLQLLESAPLVWQKVPEANFVFIGPAVGNSDQVFANADARIHRLGKVSLQAKTDALAACTVLCVPSTQESFGAVYTEAWHFSKPVIGCHIPAVAEVIQEGVDGFLVEQTPAEIADRICQLLLNSSMAASMGAAGHEKAENRYSWAELARRTENAYLDVLRG